MKNIIFFPEEIHLGLYSKQAKWYNCKVFSHVNKLI